MRYHELVGVFAGLEAESSTLKKADLLAGLLSRTPPDLLKPVVYMTTGNIFPPWMNREINVGDKTVISAIVMATGATKIQVQNLLREQGDLGSVATLLLTSRAQHTLFRQELTVAHVHQTFQKIAGMDGSGSQDAKISSVAELISNARPESARYIIRTALGQLRMGVGDGIMRDAISSAFTVNKEVVEKANAVLNDYGEVAVLASRGESELTDLKLRLFRPIKVMLYPKAEKVDDALASAGQPAQFEFKYDGFRTQIHKKGEEVRIYTRRLDDITFQFPDVVTAVRRGIRAREAIIDSETIGIDPATGRWVPFQNISQRIRRKYDIEKLVQTLPVETHVFDLLFLDGRSLLDMPLAERFRRVQDVVTPDPSDGIRVAEHLVTADPAQARAFYQTALDRGLEGIMVKNLQAGYKPGQRVGLGYKVKPETETLDLVIVGADWGEGRRTSWLSSFELAVVGPDGGFLPAGKMGTGMTDSDLTNLTETLKPDITRQHGKQVQLKPRMVVEVGYQEIQKSPTYASGFALRFPRLVRIRDDRKPEDADTLDRLKTIYAKQFSRGEKP